MLVYANYVPLRATGGLRAPLGPVAEWLSKKLRRRIATDAILRGGEIYRKDGWSVTSAVVTDDYPYLLAVELVHPDAEVSGRRWHSEIGLQQGAAGTNIDLTVLIHTSEISSRVNGQIAPGAPTFVAEILRRCDLSSAAVGGDRRTLSDDDAEAFRYVVLDDARTHPLVVVSPKKDGEYLFNLDLLAELLIGIAELVVVPHTADTFWLARSVGEDFVPYLGAAKIVYPIGSIGRPTVNTVTRQDIEAKNLDARAAARELFSLILHRTNLPLSWRHVGLPKVREAQIHRELARRRADAKATGDAAEYTRLLEEVLKDQELATAHALEEKRRVEAALTTAQRVADEAERQLRAKNDALIWQLENAAASGDESPYAPEDLGTVADTVAASIQREPTPEECLRLIEHLFAARVTVLPEAWTSARESVAFRHGRRLYALLHTLAQDYWADLANGVPDQNARRAFGNAYAAKESEGVASNKGAKRKRTFRYAGENQIFEKHLKIGVKDSSAETIRVHFEWFADRRRIVIGHCGAHLDFD